MKIDAHQHYWQVARGDYGWLTPEVGPIYRDYGPADLKPHIDAAGIERTVVVQAAPTLAETEFLLDMAERQPSIAGVVGWVDLADPDMETTLRHLANRPKFCGIRPMLQDMEDKFFILRDENLAALSLLPKLGLTFDALIRPRHLPVIAALADRLPDLPVVVDHGAKPFIAKGVLEPWAADMSALALRPNVFCKLSGLATEAGGVWSAETLSPYVRHLLACFGPDRLMFGSDWPVLELAGSYSDWVSAAESLTAHLPEAARAAVFGGTAARFYGLSD